MSRERQSVDRIFIRDLALRCIIGIYPEERRAAQDIVINIELETDVRRAAETDSIDDTVDYKSIKKRIIAMVEVSSFGLIETLASRIADLCLDSPGVRRASVTLDKPGALRFATSVAVQVVRARPVRRRRKLIGPGG